MKRTRFGDALCPVARTLDTIGDWWTLLIVRDAFNGIRRFSDFQQSLGLAKNILSTRLRMLVQNEILEKRPLPDESGRCEYHLTEKGRRLRLILTALRQWGEDYLFEEGEPMMVAHDSTNRPIARLQLLNLDGRIVDPTEVVVTRGRKKAARETLPAPRRASRSSS